MGRSVAGGLDQSADKTFVGKKLGDILNSFNIRVATGTTEFWPPHLWPVPELPNAPVDGFSTTNTVTDTRPQSRPNPNGTDEDTWTTSGFTKYPGTTNGFVWVMQRVHLNGPGLKAPDWICPTNFREDTLNNRCADTECNQIVYIEPSRDPTFSLSAKTGTTTATAEMALVRVDLCTNENGTWAYYLWTSQDVTNLDGSNAGSVSTEVVGVSKAKFIGSATMYQVNYAQPKAAGLIPYKSAYFKQFCPPIKGATSLPSISPETSRFSLANDMKQFKFVSPGSTANVFTVVCVQGQMMIHADTQIISDDFLDDWTCTSVTGYLPSSAVEISHFQNHSYTMASSTRGESVVIPDTKESNFANVIAPAFLPDARQFEREAIARRCCERAGYSPDEIEEFGVQPSLDEYFGFIHKKDIRDVVIQAFMTRKLVPLAEAHSGVGAAIAVSAFEGASSGLGHWFGTKHQQKLWMERADKTAALTMEIDKARAYNNHVHQVEMMKQKNALAAAQANTGMNHVQTTTPEWGYGEANTRSIGTTMYRDTGTQAGKQPRLNPISNMKKTYSAASTYDPMDDYVFANQRPRNVSVASTTMSEQEARGLAAQRAAHFAEVSEERAAFNAAQQAARRAEVANAKMEAPIVSSSIAEEKKQNAQRDAERTASHRDAQRAAFEAAQKSARDSAKAGTKVETPTVPKDASVRSKKSTTSSVKQTGERAHHVDKTEAMIHEPPPHATSVPRASTASEQWTDFDYFDPNDMPNSIVFTNSNRK